MASQFLFEGGPGWKSWGVAMLGCGNMGVGVQNRGRLVSVVGAHYGDLALVLLRPMPDDFTDI